MVARHDNLDGSTFLTRLAWDSAHFGFDVAMLGPPDLDDARLGQALRQARAECLELVYWPSSEQRLAPSALLTEFSGQLVDQKVTFGAPLASLLAREGRPPRRAVAVREYPVEAPTQSLTDLAIAAGLWSRFAVDPRFPRSKFESLYTLWMQRSTLREVAQTVLVVTPSSQPEQFLGFVTVSLAGAEGRIGLIAVHPSARGGGLGSHLLQAAHRYMAAGGAARAAVVTQLANVPACRLYRGAGYEAEIVQNYYHFWPQADRPGRAERHAA